MILCPYPDLVVNVYPVIPYYRHYSYLEQPQHVVSIFVTVLLFCYISFVISLNSVCNSGLSVLSFSVILGGAPRKELVS